jgi:uncharacterized protein
MIPGKSLTYYHLTYSPPLRIRYSLKNLSLDDGLLYIPLFMADYTRHLIDIAMERER